ncbi:DUF4384 domain-containing protein [Leptospira sarikeiensis]|uniref:DUF4384 domain-containing protein n=1 Tax=Leptospira sarikeiensis TaxID=2484943 RepID=A0A4R9KBN5_9LEPT|nr:DUF4384 domain-containing protein [Leptospira sarikeiensis]TGL64178.1 DUF4384 domain-containing protein [Leptospira sarikeiensis]
MVRFIFVQDAKKARSENGWINPRLLFIPLFFIHLFCVTSSSVTQTSNIRSNPKPEKNRSEPSFIDKFNLALISEEGIPTGLEDDLKELLLRSERINLADRKKTADALNELSLNQTGITDTRNSPKLGKLLSVQKLVYLKRQKEKFSLELMDVESSKSEFIRSFTEKKSEKIYTELLGYLTQNLLLKNLNGLKPKNSDIKISLSSSRPVYFTNDPVQFTIRSSEDCYIHLILLQSDGETILLFPNAFNSNNFLKANTDLIVPDGKSGYILAAGEPYGKDSIKVIASKSQLNLFSTRSYGDSPFGIIERPIESVNRGIKLIQTSLPEGEWNTSELEIQTKEN